MSEGDNRQLLVAGAVALLVLAAGGYAWFGASQDAADPKAGMPLDLGTRRLQPSDPVPRSGASTGAAPRIEMAAGLKVPRVLPQGATAPVHAALTALEPRFQSCFAAELKRDPAARGRAMLGFPLRDGAVSGEVSVEMRALNSPTLQGCLREVAASGDYSAAGGKVQVWWPLAMRPDQGLSVQAPEATR